MPQFAPYCKHGAELFTLCTILTTWWRRVVISRMFFYEFFNEFHVGDCSLDHSLWVSFGYLTTTLGYWWDLSVSRPFDGVTCWIDVGELWSHTCFSTSSSMKFMLGIVVLTIAWESALDTWPQLLVTYETCLSLDHLMKWHACSQNSPGSK